MHLIILCHPPSLGSTSMPRFARLIGEGMQARGHEVEYLTSRPFFARLGTRAPAGLRKWLGYIDQFLLFPFVLRKRAGAMRPGELFVVADQALGMWVPSIEDYPHVVHCHDFLAQRSALGQFPENPTGWTGRQYQRLIRRGYRRGKNFISVSAKTREDLQAFLDRPPERSVVVHNPLHYPFTPLPRDEALARLPPALPFSPAGGFILHLGGNQWYKNREGVVLAYREYARLVERPLPLLMAGQTPSASLRQTAAETTVGRVCFAENLSDAQIHAAYASACLLFFPSLEEGFGWPIIEAEACGCLVLTTAAAPMSEIGGSGAFYLGRKPAGDAQAWASEAGLKLREILEISASESHARIATGLENVRRFEVGSMLARYEDVYRSIIEAGSSAGPQIAKAPAAP